jgi:hypothetical protein
MSRPRGVGFGWALVVLLPLLFARLSASPEQDKGPAWRIHDMTPGVFLTMKESDRFKVSGKTRVMYSLEASGFPQDKSYGVWIWNFGDPEGWLMMKDFTPDPAGRLMCEHPISEDEAVGGKNRSCVFDLEKLALRATASIKGVPFRVGILSTDGSVKAFARAVPLPLQFRQGGCTVSAELASDKADAFLIQGDGYAPGETVAWSAEMGDTTTEDSAVASKAGSFVVAINPGATGKESGKVVFTARGKSCAPALIFKWGPPFLK